MKLTYKDSCQLSESEVIKCAESLLPFLKHLQDIAKKNNYEDDESSINLPFDLVTIGEVKALAGKMTSQKLKYILNVGIGGSYLGTKAVYDAAFGYFDIINPERFPKIIFLDTVDPEFMEKVSSLLKTISSKEEVLVNIISKSGTTTEPLANFETILPILTEANDRIVVTADKDSLFFKESKDMGYSVLDLPKKVGGRYSVFSSVGLFPLAAAGIDIDKLLLGAKSMRDLCMTEDFLSNPAMISSVILYLHNQQGKNINDNFIFHPELESLGKWYRQLMGESIGKEKIIDGKKEFVGMTPTVSIGSVDLHSVAQLYIGGPRDKVTTFITAPSASDIGVPEKMSYPTLVPQISGKSLTHVMNAIFDGTSTVYKNQKLPYIHVTLDDLSPRSLGEFMQFKMIEMMFLAKLLGVNGFDQPHVELYKKETKKLLLDNKA